jgi:hypothetical protein
MFHYELYITKLKRAPESSFWGQFPLERFVHEEACVIGITTMQSYTSFYERS